MIQHMATQKHKFPVAEFTIRGGVLKQEQRNALVRSAMASVAGEKKTAKKKTSAGSALKTHTKGK